MPDMNFWNGRYLEKNTGWDLGQRKNDNGMHFWARGYYVSTGGADEEVIRNDIRNQEKEDQKLEALTGM